MACLLTAAPARALINIDGTRNQVFVFGGVTVGYNSNIFAESGGDGDSNLTAHVGMEWKRRAGLIAVDSTLRFDYVAYRRYTDENSLNPHLTVTFSKDTGRTTGALQVNAYRETRSDNAVNLRTDSWNFPVSLSLKYPVNEKLNLSSTTGYLRRTYNESNLGLVDYRDFTQSLDLFYIYTSKLDLIGGYRLRLAKTAANGRSTDHWFNVGATGSLFSKMTGTVRVGYQLRRERQPAHETYGQLNALASVDWAFTRKITLSMQVSRDFDTIATGSSIDATSVTLQGVYTYSSKLDFSASATAGRNKFLTTTAPARKDAFFTWTVGAGYKPSQHLSLGASYHYMRNWSTLSLGDYENHGFSIDISSRY